MTDEESYDILNRILSNKVLEYNGQFFYGVIDVKCRFKIKITGTVYNQHMGMEKKNVGIEVTILSLEPDIFITLLRDTPKTWWEIKNRLFYFSSALENTIYSFFKFFSIDDSPLIVNIIVPDEEKQLSESTSEKRGVVREIVQDIVKTFKDKGDGYYSLPEDLDGNMTYQFEEINTEFSIELEIVKSLNVEGIEIDGGYFEDDDTIEIQIVYNPSYFPQIYYDLVGQLNDLVRHELQHIIQIERGDDAPTKKISPEKYYLQPHELDAQIAGIKRLSKLKGESFEQTLRDWFYKNEPKHGLTQKQQEKIINKILSQV